MEHISVPGSGGVVGMGFVCYTGFMLIVDYYALKAVGESAEAFFEYEDIWEVSRMQQVNEWKGFNRVVGHQQIITHLQNAIASDTVSNAYIFGGEDGSGKKMLATLYAMALECREKDRPCMMCSSCKKASDGNHPDIIYVKHEKPNTISVDDVRRQLVDDVAIRPYESRYKIYIIEDAEKMTPQAQNAILKTIEEPPEYVVILLLTTNPEALLPTIQSRCVTLNLRPVRDRQVKEFLMSNLHVPDYKADILTSFAQGNVGKAIEAARSPEFEEMTEKAIQILKSYGNRNVGEVLDVVRMMSDDKQNINEYLEFFSMWFRDVLMFKATREVDSLIFKDEINAIRSRASVSSYEGLEKILEAIEKAEQRLRANVNFDLVMELLFLTIREN